VGTRDVNWKDTLKAAYFSVLLTASIILVGCSSTPSGQSNTVLEAHKAYAVPSEFFLKAHADRGVDGGIVISGTTNLPDGLKIWVEIEVGRLPLGAPKVVSSDEDVFVKNGAFQTEALWLEVPNTTFKKTGWPKGVAVNVRKKPFPQGPAKVHFEAFFNGAWQANDVLKDLGNNEGKNLKGAIFKATDPDVSDSPKTLDHRQMLAFPVLSPEAKAINLVKATVLTVPGEGRSAGDVQANLDLFLASPGMTLGKGWNTKALSPANYEVSYDFIDGSEGEKQAIWTVNLGSNAVKYVNESAKRSSVGRLAIEAHRTHP